MIRAKFRCMSSTDSWNHYRSYEFLPVMADEGAPENVQFWDATPSGKAELHYKAHVDDPAEFIVGDFYYIDMELTDDESDWEISRVTDNGDWREAMWSFGPHVTDYDKRGPRRGHVEMNVNNPGAFGQFGKAKHAWSVTFTHAGASSEPLPKH